MRPDRSELIATLPFAPDRFQVEAFDALDAGRNVVVAAPTGSGKTVVAEYGIAADRVDGRRSFYTAPIKALSNQKYRDLVEIHGDDAVGLLTGDNSINGDAPIVVMTTEVLRNMIYAGRDLTDLATVVVDEVHFLQDTYRGPVWEEVIIHLPHHIRLIALSATVSNVAELADWIGTVRGPTDAVVERQRPVELSNKYLVADRDENRLHLLEMFIGGGLNRDALRLDESAARRRPRRDDRRGGARVARPPRAGADSPHRAGSTRWSCSTIGGCCLRSSSSSAEPSATKPPKRASMPGSCSVRTRSEPRSGRSSRTAWPGSIRTISRCSATNVSSGSSRPASPPTMREWCRR